LKGFFTYLHLMTLPLHSADETATYTCFSLCLLPHQPPYWYQAGLLYSFYGIYAISQ
jgi:hypothetical protein